MFRGVKEIRDDCLRAKVVWDQNWITFMDSVLFCDRKVLASEKRELLVPSDIRKLVINPKLHYEIIDKSQGLDEILIDVTVCPLLDIIKAGGLEVHEKRSITLPRRRPREVLLETHKFIPYSLTERLTKLDALKICTQLLFENDQNLKITTVEIDEENANDLLSPSILEAVADLPLVVAEVICLTKREIEINNVKIEHDKELPMFSNMDLIVATEKLHDQEFLALAAESLSENGFLLSRESSLSEEEFDDYQVLMTIPADDEVFHILKCKRACELPTKVIRISLETENWLPELQKSLKEENVLVYSQSEPSSGIIGLMNCLRKEPHGERLTCFFISDDTAPAFDIDHAFYKKQLSFGMKINVFMNKQWGSYRHLKLHSLETERPRSDHCFANCLTKGDLTSLTWMQGYINLENPSVDRAKIIKIQFSSLNFKDVMHALGRIEQKYVLGFEFAGVNELGRRLMGIARTGGAIATFFDSQNLMAWDVPANWSLAEASTVPLAYCTVYSAFFVSAKVKRGQSILIHSGSGGVGQAAMHVAFAYGLNVFTTVGTDEKRKFLLDKFACLKPENIGNSRDTTFEKMVLKRTSGRGVDFVLNSLSDEKLQASIRCLATNGTLLDLGQVDILNRTPIHMGHLARRINFKAIFFDDLPTDSDYLKVRWEYNRWIKFIHSQYFSLSHH